MLPYGRNVRVANGHVEDVLAVGCKDAGVFVRLFVSLFVCLSARSQTTRPNFTKRVSCDCGSVL